MVKRIGSGAELGSSLMFDFEKEFLEIMNAGGKAVVKMYEEDKDSLVDVVWMLKIEKYVCENKNISYDINEFIEYLDNENCNNIDVLDNDVLKINVFLI